MLFNMFDQQIRAYDHSAFSAPVVLKEPAQGIAFFVGKMFFPEQRVTEGETGRDRICPHERRHVFGSFTAVSHSAAAPETIRRSAVNRADLTLVIEILSVLTVQLQKDFIQFIKLIFCVADELLMICQTAKSNSSTKSCCTQCASNFRGLFGILLMLLRLLTLQINICLMRGPLRQGA